MDDEVREEGEQALACVDRLLEIPHHRPLGSLAERLREADGSLAAWVGDQPARELRAAPLRRRVQAAALQVQAREVVRRREAAERLQVALRNLQQIDSTEELAERVPDEVSRLGFHRVLFSWVDRARWVPVSFRTHNGPEEARAVMEAGEPPYWHTQRLLEGEMVAHRQPMLVRDALGNPRVHLDIQAVMHSHSYVAAPVTRSGQVVAFVHADQNADLGWVDEVDRDVVHLFAEGLSLALDRAAMLEQLTALRHQIGQHAVGLSDLLRGEAPIDVPDLGEAATAVRRPPAAQWADALTRREEEVLALVAGGLTNAQIAHRLYITEGTVKTHLKTVRRKGGADNRAHAGALFHQHWKGGVGGG